MLPEATDRDALLALLDFYVAAGVDVFLDDAPRDRFAEAEEPSSAAMASDPLAPPVPDGPRGPHPLLQPTAPRAVAPVATPPAEEVAADARRRAASAATLDELEAIVAAFDGCSLKTTASRLCFADGSAGARVMLVGEAPGAEEDRTGRPFVGRAGQLLGRMLEAIGLARADVYIANVVPWRPPGNRTPTPQEVAICLPFLRRQIALVAPAILVAVGAPSTQALTGTKDGIMRARGRWLTLADDPAGLRVLPMLHPAFLLRQPLHKRLAWRDLRTLKRALDDAGPPSSDPR